MIRTGLVALSLFVLGAVPALADSAEARCEVHPAGSELAVEPIPCLFSQAQGYVTIALEDGTEINLSPAANYNGYSDMDTDQPVTRDLGLGDAGLIFHMVDASIYVYW